jgi:hypothetical protein
MENSITKRRVYPQVVETNYLASTNVIESLYDREGAKGCVGCKSHKDIKFQKLFIIPCQKTFQSKYLNDSFMTKPRKIVFEGEGGMKKDIQKWLPQGF